MLGLRRSTTTCGGTWGGLLSRQPASKQAVSSLVD